MHNTIQRAYSKPSKSSQAKFKQTEAGGHVCALKAVCEFQKMSNTTFTCSNLLYPCVCLLSPSFWSGSWLAPSRAEKWDMCAWSSSWCLWVCAALQAAASEPTEVLSHSSSMLWVCLENRCFPILPDSVGYLHLTWVFLSHSQKKGRFDINIWEGWRITNCMQTSVGHTGAEECPLDCAAS